MFRLNKSYNFTTLAPSVLGGNFKLMKVLSISAAADLKGIDVDAIQKTIEPLIIGGLPKVADQTFVKFVSTDGREVILSESWIDSASVVEVTSPVITIVITGESSDIVKTLEDDLNMKGIKQFTISVE